MNIPISPQKSVISCQSRENDFKMLKFLSNANSSCWTSEENTPNSSFLNLQFLHRKIDIFKYHIVGLLKSHTL